MKELHLYMNDLKEERIARGSGKVAAKYETKP